MDCNPSRGAKSVMVKRLWACLLLSIALDGCDKCFPPKPTPTPTPSPTPTCTEPAIDANRSLVVHDPALLEPVFSLKRTLEQIIATSGASAITPDALLQTMLDSFGQSSFVQPISTKSIPVDPRQEKTLSTANLLDPNSPDGMVPVGLFNRLDLAPADGSNCGEYRIVYARKQFVPLRRFFIIFEAKLPNPKASTLGLAGCQPVAKFWADLTSQTNPSGLVSELERLYYTGLTADGFGAVVTHANYGVPLGQVRTNLFIQQPWMLREHRTALDAGGNAAFVADTVKENPLVEWFRDPSTLPSGLTAADQQAFRTHFLNQPMCNLLRPDRANSSATPAEIVNGIGGGFDPAGDEFQSVSQGLSDDPADNTDPAFEGDIATRITALGSSATSKELLNRSGAMTCGGCHEFSNGRALGSGASWPNSGGFVHISEQGNLSNALTSVFLPRRAEILKRFVCNPTPAPQSEAPCPSAQRIAPTPLPEPSGPVGSTAEVEPATAEKLRQGRTTPSLQRVDEARLAVLAAATRLRSARDTAAGDARRALDEAKARLEAEVLRARVEERALPGAFVPVRRVH